MLIRTSKNSKNYRSSESKNLPMPSISFIWCQFHMMSVSWCHFHWCYFHQMNWLFTANFYIVRSYEKLRECSTSLNKLLKLTIVRRNIFFASFMELSSTKCLPDYFWLRHLTKWFVENDSFKIICLCCTG